MVSLGAGRPDSRQAGGFFFTEREPSVLVQSPDDEDLLLTHNLQTEEEPHFKQCNTVWVAGVQILLITSYMLMSVLLPYVIEPHFTPKKDDQLQNAFIYIALSHPAVWLLLLLADRFLQYKHTVLRRHGYLEFTQKTRNMRRTAEFMFSLGNALMLVVAIIRFKFIKPIEAATADIEAIHGVNYQEIIIGIESIISLFFCIRYAVVVYKFNRSQAPPDAEQEEQMNAVMQPSTHLPDIGFRDSQYVDSLLEKQADMIRYLKHHTEHLSKRILKLRTAHSEGRLMGSVQS